MVNGPRQCGKTTMAREFGKNRTFVGRAKSVRPKTLVAQSS
jgi:predicted AAA+ superfamily ATPase